MLTLDLEAVFANLHEDCRLGNDFLHKSGLFDNFHSIFPTKFHFKRIVYVNNVISKNHSYLPGFFEDSFKKFYHNLNENQKNQFNDFLIEIQKAFSCDSKDIGICNLIEHY